MGAYAQGIINAGCRKLQWLRYVVGGQAFGMVSCFLFLFTSLEAELTAISTLEYLHGLECGTDSKLIC